MKDYSQYKLNIIPSPPDSRDWKYETIVKGSIINFPETLDWRMSMFTVRDQGYQGSCAAMSGAAMKDWQEIKDVGVNEYMSPQFIYNNRENKISEGMTIRDLMHILKDIGTCRESLHPYGNIEPPSQVAYADAAEYMIAGYASIESIDGLKTALFENGPCVIALPVYNYTTRMWFKRLGDTQLGGHAMTSVGYDSNGFIIRNSWGDDWGDEGYTIFPYEDWGLQWEVWSTIDADSFPSPDPDPGPIPPKPSWWKNPWYWAIGLAVILGIIAFFAFK